MLAPRIGGEIKRPWTATIAIWAWLGIIMVGILLSLYDLTVLAPVSFWGVQAFWTVFGTVVTVFYLALIAGGTAMVLRGLRSGLILLSVLATLTILVSIPALPLWANLAWGPPVPEVSYVHGIRVTEPNWQVLYRFNFIDGLVLFVLLPGVGAVFGWLPRTLRWVVARRRAMRAARTSDVTTWK